MNWHEFKKRKDDKNLKDDLTEQMLRYLDCECTVFMPMEDDTELMRAYERARERKDVVPMLVRVDATLMECFLLNSDPQDADEDQMNEMDSILAEEPFDLEEGDNKRESEASIWKFNLSRVRAYREKMLHAELVEGDVYFEHLEERAKEYAAEMGWEYPVSSEDVSDHTFLQELQKESESKEAEEDGQAGASVGNGEAETDNRRYVLNFGSIWEYGTGMTSKTILALIPVGYPWEVFAWLPFGGWNECPDTLDLMSAGKYWYEQYGAIPAAVSHDELEFVLPRPLTEEEAEKAAREQYLFCPDIVDQNGDGTIGYLQDILEHSIGWYFWWD